MTAQIFNFRNVKVRLTDTNITTVYGVTAYDSGNPNSTLPNGVLPTDVSTVVLTVQCANITGLSTLPAPANAPTTINVSVMINNSTNINSTTYLVQDYPVIPYNAFDPLSGNLVLTSGDQLQVQGNFANGIDVIVTLLEIANASAT